MMSYINEALKKAQRDRDSRYERFGGIIASGSAGTQKPGRRKLAVGSAIALMVLIPAALLTVHFLKQPSPVEMGSLPSVLSENGETKPAMIPKAATDGASPAGDAAVSPGGSPDKREAEVRYIDALTAHRRGDHRRAEDLYHQALMHDPGHVRALNNLGVLFMDQKKRGQAVSLFNRAIVLRKDYVDPYYNLACLYARAEETDESLRYLKMAMAINTEAVSWAMKDADMSSVVASDAFKKMMEGQKN